MSFLSYILYTLKLISLSLSSFLPDKILIILSFFQFLEDLVVDSVGSIMEIFDNSTSNKVLNSESTSNEMEPNKTGGQEEKPKNTKIRIIGGIFVILILSGAAYYFFFFDGGAGGGGGFPDSSSDSSPPISPSSSSDELPENSLIHALNNSSDAAESNGKIHRLGGYYAQPKKK